MRIGWHKRRLGELCQLISGQHIDSSDYNTDGRGIGYLTGPSDFGPLNPLVSKWTEYPKVTAKHGDILVTVKGSGVGKLNILDEDEVAISRQLMAIRVEDAHPKFIYSYLESVFDHIQSLSTGAAIPGISRDQILNLEIDVPNIAEQQRIVAILDEAFEGIATARAIAEQNLRSARSLFVSVLESVRGESSPLGDYVRIRTGKLDANAAIENGSYPFFTCAKEIYAIDNYAFDCEAILLAGNNAVGDFNVKHYKGKFNAYQRTYVITIEDEARLSYRFLYFHMLKSLRKFKKDAVGAGTKFLKLGMIKELEISLPNIAQQAEIASKLDSLLEETQRLESIYQQKLEALDDLKKSLLHQAFSGALLV